MRKHRLPYPHCWQKPLPQRVHTSRFLDVHQDQIESLGLHPSPSRRIFMLSSSHMALEIKLPGEHLSLWQLWKAHIICLRPVGGSSLKPPVSFPFLYKKCQPSKLCGSWHERAPETCPSLRYAPAVSHPAPYYECKPSRGLKRWLSG